MSDHKLIIGDVQEALKKIPDESISMCVTSPPYWGLRDYGKGTETIWGGDSECEHEWGVEKKVKINKSHVANEGNANFHGGKIKPEQLAGEVSNGKFCIHCGAWKGQLGLEPDPDMFISHLCDIFDIIKDKLTPWGSCYVNLGDSYSGSGAGQKDTGKAVYTQKEFRKRPLKTNLPGKCLVSIPARFQLEMINMGWILRNVLIWYKNNTMPSSVSDRFTVDFEYIFFFVKNKKYYFEQQFEDSLTPGSKHVSRDGDKSSIIKNTVNPTYFNRDYKTGDKRNYRAVWNINTKPYSDAHYAVFPEELIKTPIKASCPKFICDKCGMPRKKIFVKELTKRGRPSDRKIARVNSVSESSCFRTNDEYTFKESGYTDCGCGAGFHPGTVLDPFVGSGTTIQAAQNLGVNSIGIDINDSSIKFTENRLEKDLKQMTLDGELKSTLKIIKI